MHKLAENHFSFKCPMNWDAMEASDNGRFCSKCRKEVFDLTNCSIDEVIALQRKHGPICGSIKIAVAAVSLAAAACHETSSTQTSDKPATPISTDIATPQNNTSEVSTQNSDQPVIIKPEATRPPEPIRLGGVVCLPEQQEKKEQK